MSVKKLNPDSATLQQLDGHWQKMAAIILHKLVGRAMVTVTSEDIERFQAEFAPGMPVVYTHGHKDSIDFQLVDLETAQRLADHDARMNKGRA